MEEITNKELIEERDRMLEEIEIYSWENDFDISVLPEFSRLDLEPTGSEKWMEKFNEIKIAYNEFKRITEK